MCGPSNASRDLLIRCCTPQALPTHALAFTVATLYHNQISDRLSCVHAQCLNSSPQVLGILNGSRTIAPQRAEVGGSNDAGSTAVGRLPASSSHPDSLATMGSGGSDRRGDATSARASRAEGQPVAMGSFRRPVLSAASHGSVGSGSAGLAASMGRAGAHSVGLLTPSASAGLPDGTAYASEIDPDMTAIQSAAGAGMAAGSMGDGEQVRPGSAQEHSRRGLGAAQQGSAPRLPSPPPRHSSFRGSSTSNAGTQVRNRSQSIQVGASGAWSGTGGTAGTVASSPAGATGSQARQV